MQMARLVCGVVNPAMRLMSVIETDVQTGIKLAVNSITTKICHCGEEAMFPTQLTKLCAVASLLVAGVVSAEAYKIIPMNQKSLATYYVQASMLGSGEVEFMVDTGAGYTTINEHTLEQLIEAENADFVGELTGVMADGSEIRLPLYRIKRLVLGEDCVLHDVDAAVFPEETRMLLGLSALEKASPFIFSTNPPRLSLSNCGTAAG
ncbi:hypothetical protein MNBD_GAMMA15-2480 [hydrothermal vent metagenome]|uniref:Peptidase A2 domain-containing protein n=1 Tax=hydrothermal vent metagenome TaxID=652676 RepID=A0A3B0Z3F4_9ZZZZ